jgi:hypothetical protein
MPARTTPPRPAPFGQFSPPKPPPPPKPQPPDLLADPFAGGDLLAPAAPAPAPAPPLLDPIFSGMTSAPAPDPFAPAPPKKGADLLGDLLAPTETKADPFADPFASPAPKAEGGGTFKIDVMAAAFGSCVCGRPKGDHLGPELRCPPVKEDPFSGL